MNAVDCEVDADQLAVSLHEAAHVVVAELLGVRLVGARVSTRRQPGSGHEGATVMESVPAGAKGLAVFAAGIALQHQLGIAGDDRDEDDRFQVWKRFIGVSADPGRARDRFVRDIAPVFALPGVMDAVEAVALVLVDRGWVDAAELGLVVVRAVGGEAAGGVALMVRQCVRRAFRRAVR